MGWLLEKSCNGGRLRSGLFVLFAAKENLFSTGYGTALTLAWFRSLLTSVQVST
jgi:hypothetical protein